MNKVKERLKKIGFELPKLGENKTLFKQCVQSGNHIYVSGQLPAGFGELSMYAGQLGGNIDIEKGKQIAKYSFLNILAQLEAFLGDLDKIKKCVKITVFVNSYAHFNEQHLVANAASQIILDIFENPDHSRSAIGVAQLPFGVAVEIEGIFEI
jgi:enamine deaminase RidA (YjgF/YER057c/UK114 family)